MRTEGKSEPSTSNIHGPFIRETPGPFTFEELEYLATLDSTQFGFLKLNNPENAKKKALVVKAVKCLEKVLVNHYQQKEKESASNNQKDKQIDSLSEKLSEIRTDDVPQEKNSTEELAKEPVTVTEIQTVCVGAAPVHVEVYCKLGHLNLLLQDYPKALSAYQKYFNLCEDHWKNSAFMYGLGLVYFHYNEYSWAIQTFRYVLYLDPGYIRSNEIHLRLAVMFKVLEDYESSYKHFKLVLADSNPCSLSRAEVSFHIAHLFEIQGNYKTSKEQYEVLSLLEQKDLSQALRAETTKQLGWMHHTIEALGEKSLRQGLSLHYIQKSIESDPTNGQSLYLLGRCYASLGKVHDAFVSYRCSIVKEEANSDTWCSVGVLYQQQNQPIDALQAYICSVQLDKTHSPAWTNLGLLYENCNQPQDALKCYVNAAAGKGPINPTLFSRVKALQNQALVPTPNNNQKQPKLPCIEDAWNFPISQEMASRQNAATQRQVNRMNPTAHNKRQSFSGVETPIVPGQGSANQLAP